MHADERDHASGHRVGSPDYVAMRRRDVIRRADVRALRASGRLTDATDLYGAARILQHGDTAQDAGEAHDLASQAVALGLRKARWLAAAALDRSLMYDGKPQKYGTQYVPDGRRQRLWDVDPATTDAERAEWDVPPLTDQLRKADEATRAGAPVSVGSDAPRWLTDAIARWHPTS